MNAQANVALPHRQKRTVGVPGNVSKRRSERVGGLPPDAPQCAYCGKSFAPARRNQKFHDPSIERKLHWARKEALISLVSDLLTDLRCKARNMQMVARKCVEAAYDAVTAAVIALGYKYDQERKLWRTKREWRQA